MGRSRVTHARVIECANREEWLSARQEFITSTEIASLAVGAWRKSAVRMWAEKRGLLQPPDWSWTDWSICGLAMEDALRKVYQTKTGRKVMPSRPWTLYVHPELPFLATSIDHWILTDDGNRVPLEGKAASAYTLRHWNSERGGPQGYVWQVHAQMTALDVPWGALAAIIDSHTFRHFDHVRDAEVSNAICRMATDFWALVVSGTPPKMDGSPDETSALLELYPEGRMGKATVLDDKQERMIRELAETKEAGRRNATHQRMLRNQILAIAGDSELLVDRNGVPLVTVRNEKAKTITSRHRATRSVRIMYSQLDESSRRLAEIEDEEAENAEMGDATDDSDGQEE